MANIVKVIEESVEKVEQMISENEEENEVTFTAILLNQAFPEMLKQMGSDTTTDEDSLMALKTTVKGMEMLMHYYSEVLEEEPD